MSRCGLLGTTPHMMAARSPECSGMIKRDRRWNGSRHAVARAVKRRTKVEQREASLEKLLSAARHLFVSKGYASTTLEEIATAVEMTKGSVYFYFGSKEAVLLELLNQAEQIVIDTVLRLLESSEGNATE